VLEQKAEHRGERGRQRQQQPDLDREAQRTGSGCGVRARDVGVRPAVGARLARAQFDVELNRADRVLVGKLGQDLVDDRVDLVLVVAEVVELPAQRRVRDLQLRGG
jgi:hypothetical protein